MAYIAPGAASYQMFSVFDQWKYTKSRKMRVSLIRILPNEEDNFKFDNCMPSLTNVYRINK